MSEQFFYDEFFIPADDPGERIEVEIGGRVVPIYLKRELSLEDVEIAKERGIKKHLDLEKGAYVVEGIDEVEFTVILLARAIKSWPFVYRNNHPVPITPEKIREFRVEGSEVLQRAVSAMLNKAKDQVDPLGKSSGDPSSSAEQASR